MNADGCVAGARALTGVVRALHERADGSIWVAGYRGLFALPGRRVTTLLDAARRAVEDCSHVDRRGRRGMLWLGTSGGGLIRFEDGRFTRYTTKQGLFDDTIFRVLLDGRGWLWLTSQPRPVRASRVADLDARRRAAATRHGRARRPTPKSTACRRASSTAARCRPASSRATDGCGCRRSRAS